MMNDEKNVIIVPKEIRKEIENLLRDRFDMLEGSAQGGRDNDFFGVYGLLEPRELTYLVYLLEIRYGIRFGVDEYDDSRFYNLSGLSEIVAEVIAKSPVKG